MPEETISIVNTVINALTAIGTIGAVALSLFFWHRSNTLVAKGRVFFFAIHGITLTPQEFLQISITNHGSRSFALNGFFAHEEKRIEYAQFLPIYPIPTSKKMNEQIFGSETGDYLFTKEKYVQTIIDYVDYIPLNVNQSKMKISRLKYFVLTNLGDKIYLKKGDDYDAILLKEIENSFKTIK